MKTQVSVVRAFEDIIKTRKKNIICVAYRHGFIFKKFKEKGNFIKTEKLVDVAALHEKLF